MSGLPRSALGCIVIFVASALDSAYFTAATFSAAILAPEPAHAGILDLDSVRMYMMEPNGVAPNDIVMMPPMAKPDPFRLSRVEGILRKPFSIDTVTREIMRRTEPYVNEKGAYPLPPDSLWPLLDEPEGAASEAVDTDSQRLEDNPFGPGFRPEVALRRIQSGLREEFADIPESDRDFLFHEAPGMFLQEEEDTARSAIENETKRLEEDARLHRIMGLASHLRWRGLLRASSAAWKLETWLIRSLRKDGLAPTAARLRKALAAKGADGRPLSREFPLHIGGNGPDRCVADQGIWIDPGGNDEYVLQGTGRPGGFRLIIDMGGDDMYLSKDSLDQGPGNMGIDLIADLSGNDRYLGRNFAFGSALFGFSSLFDAAGSDYYEGRCASLGFAFFGLGVLEDEAGNDVYSASLMSEGAGATKGAGLLLDRRGNDQYLARPTFEDDLRYTDHYIHMVQGFGTGFAPDFAGGIGLLRDGAGNDLYVADIFAQGSAYWYALGLLIDEGGDDRYEAHQYAQGAGVHIAVGALIDLGGDDRYASKGVSQGCGHDYGFGLLYDRNGNDTYLATDMSQGAGSANGLGILYDAAGDDIYQSVNPEMALGHADMRRDRGSFGFFFDGGGKDKYSLPRADGAAWRVFNGKNKGNGFGLDK